MTARQVFYQLVGLRVIDKTEDECNNLVVRQLAKLRLERVLPWSWITDGTVGCTRACGTGASEEALVATRRHYRRDYWRELDDCVESVEVDALPPVTLLGLVRGAIERHVGRARVALLEAFQASERELLGGLPAMLQRNR